MKKIIAAVTLFVASAVAFALPSPRQIEDALMAKDYNSARSMVSEVLREKPESAKAHLFNSYILLKTGDKGGAAQELQTASRLDKNGDVKNSALFGRTVALLEANPPVVQKPVTYAPAQQYVPVQQQSSGSGWTVFWWIVGIAVVGGVVYYFFFRKKEEPFVNNYYTNPSPSPRSSGVFSGGGSGYTGSTGGNNTTVVHTDSGSMNGFVNGMLLSEVMHSHHDHGRSNSYYSTSESYPSRSYSSSNSSDDSSVDYESKRSSYSSGSSSSWSNDDSSSSSSSSSWDSGSSSSSSWDSGSSSSGSDW